MAPIKGSVFYLQRIALSPGSVVTVEARDAEDRILGTWTLETSGEQVPIDWRLDLADGLPATVNATIESDGRAAWTGRATVPADPPAGGIAIRLVQAQAPPPGDGPTEAEVEAVEVTELESLGGGLTY